MLDKKNIKIIILCGGKGTRLKEETVFQPKPLVRIGDKPILWHIMKTFGVQGFNQFILTLGYKGEMIKEYFLNYQNLIHDSVLNTKTGTSKIISNHEIEDWDITMVNTGVENLKGSRIKQVEKYCNNGINIIAYGDTLSDVNINEVIEFHLTHGKIATLIGVRPPSMWGQLHIEGNQVIKFEEKPQTIEGVINGGFIVFNQELFNFLSEDPKCDFEIGPLNELANIGELMCYPYDGFHICMDTKRDQENIELLWRSNHAPWKVW